MTDIHHRLCWGAYQRKSRRKAGTRPGIITKMKLESQEMERSIQDDTEENTRQEIKKPDLKEQGNREYPQDGMKELEENVDSLQEYVFQNTTSDNQEIIEQGEELKRELYRYLAAAYDREEMKEQAVWEREVLPQLDALFEESCVEDEYGVYLDYDTAKKKVRQYVKERNR